VADILCRDHGFVRYALAKPIKDMLRVIGVDADNRETKEKPNPIFGVSPRRMAQTLGTEWMRDTIHKDGWLLLADVFLRAAVDTGAAGVVITDVRFPNEAAWLAERDGVVWHIRRPGICPVEAHASENGIGVYPGDLIIPNTGSIADLADTVRKAIESPHLFAVTGE
jgi:hypothetical protein